MLIDTLGCNWSHAHWLIFSNSVLDPLIYYSHFFPLVCAIFLSVLVYVKVKSSPLRNSFLSLTTAFSLWLFSDIVLWANDKPELVMWFWAITILLEPMIYIFGLYFLITYINDQELFKAQKIIMLCLLLPTFILLPTTLAVKGFDYTNCDRNVVEGPLVAYNYIIEFLITLWAVAFTFHASRKETARKKKLYYLLTVGLILFFCFFALGNVIGSFTANWQIGQWLLFGMPIYLAFLALLITNAKTEGAMKLFGIQSLVVIIMFLTASQFLFLRGSVNHVLAALALFLVFLFGWWLINSVKKEYAQGEKLADTAKELGSANSQLKEVDKIKSDFLIITAHQLRTPMSEMNGYDEII